MNLIEVVSKIKSAGSSNVRIIPMDGQDVVNGLHRIEVNQSGNWSTVVTGMPKSMAESVVKQAFDDNDKVILG